MLKTLVLEYWTGAGGYPLGAEFKSIRTIVDDDSDQEEQFQKVLKDNNVNESAIYGEAKMIYFD